MTTNPFCDYESVFMKAGFLFFFCLHLIINLYVLYVKNTVMYMSVAVD